MTERDEISDVSILSPSPGESWLDIALLVSISGMNWFLLILHKFSGDVIYYFSFQVSGCEL